MKQTEGSGAKARPQEGMGGPPGVRDYAGSLMVMLTHECPLRCAYCGVVRDRRSMTWMVLRRGVDLLCASESPRLQLRYFGGEPLLKFDLIRRAIVYSEKQCRRLGKKVHHMITTNGLALDESKLAWFAGRDVEFLFSLDGSAVTHGRWRPAPGGLDTHPRLLANLRALRRSGASYFVNLVAHPGESRQWSSDLDFTLSLGVRRLQIGYCVGVEWGEEARQEFLAFMEAAVERCGRIELLNLKSGAEPVMLSEEVIAETDGRLYLDPAVFVERSFPALKKAMLLGRLGETRSLAAVRRTKNEVLELFRRCYPSSTAKGRLLLNNLGLGLEVGRLMSRLAG
ncbi:MAG: radical SAM protein [Elusimicrobia bacterium]|nr:radical SAM protein [Elusimicrobiota bacterium]